MRFDLVDLKLFLNIVEAGSITNGARHSSPTLQAASPRLSDRQCVVEGPSV